MKNVLITGVGKGIGKALAEKFLKEGFFVIGTIFSGEASKGGNISLHKLDLSSRESIASCAKEIASLGKKIEILINNAGVLLDEDETKVIPEKLRRTLEVNLIGTADFTELVIPLMEKGGHIVNISSTAGSLEMSGRGISHHPYHYPAYKISKTALNMYTVTLASRLKEKEIIVSSVHPGWVRTEMGGENADISPEEAAEGIFKIAVSRPETGKFWFQGEELPW